jgi:pyridoxine kinase
MYVPPGVLPIYRDVLLPLADIITPNAYEAELLTGIRLSSLAEGKRALAALHGLGVPTVIITSVDWPTAAPGTLTLLASSVGEQEGAPFQIAFPKFPGRFTGTGDLFAALLLAHVQAHGVREACVRAVTTLHAVLKRTLAECGEGEALPPTMQARELRIIESRDVILGMGGSGGGDVASDGADLCAMPLE